MSRIIFYISNIYLQASRTFDLNFFCYCFPNAYIISSAASSTVVAVTPTGNPFILADSPVTRRGRILPVSEVNLDSHSPKVRLTLCDVGAAAVEASRATLAGYQHDALWNNDGTWTSNATNSKKNGLDVSSLQLSGAAGYTVNIERGERNITFYTICEIAEKLNRDVAFFCQDIPPIKPGK